MITSMSNSTLGWRRWSPLLTVVTGSIITLLVTYGGYSVVLREYEKQFDYDARSRSTLIHDYLHERLGDLDSLHRFIEGTAGLNRPAFREFVKPLLDRQGIQAMEWIPVVPDARRNLTEKAALRDGLSGFHFKEKSSRGMETTAAKRDVYYPVYYVEPQKGNEKALGFDLGSNTARLEAILAADATDRPHATAPLKLVQERGSQTGFLIFAPVKATVSKEHGFALGVFRVGDMLTAAVGPTAGIPLETTLSDLSGKTGPELLSRWRKEVTAPQQGGILSRWRKEVTAPQQGGILSGWRKEVTAPQQGGNVMSLLFPLPALATELPFAGRRWQIRTKATPEYRAGSVSLLFLTSFPAGMLITALITLYMRKLLRYGEEVELLVTERTAALRESEARRRTLFESTTDAIFAMDRETIFDCNPATLLTFGIGSREEILGKRPDELSPLTQLSGEESRVAAERIIGRALAEGAQRFEWLHCRLDTGKNFIAEVCLTPVELNDRIFLQAIVRDITGQKQAQRELSDNREMLSLILNSTAEAIYGIDLVGCCTFCNRACLELLGYDDEGELLGKNMHDICHHTCTDGSFFPVENCRIFRAFQAGEGTHADDELLWRRDGSSFPSEYWSYPQSKNGEIVGAVVTFFNISQRKQAETALFDNRQQLLTINLRLEQLVRDEVQKNREKDHILLQQDKLASIGQLAAGVAHEINNPMGYISSNLRTLTEYFDQVVQFDRICLEKVVTELTSPTREAMNRSRSSLEIDQILEDGADLIRESLQGAERVAKIVMDLKSFSRVDTAQRNEPVELTSCMESALNVCYNELKYKAVIRKEYQPVPQVICNSGHLNQVFLNLLVNAGQAMVAPGEIVLSCRHDDSFVYASVSDTGSGIPDEVLKRIFDPFFTTKEVGKGTGLGLSISSEVIRQHGGELLVKSEVGRGTTFTIKLPRSSDDQVMS